LERRTRIVATLGPVSSSPAAIRRLIRAGVDVVRLNFSHGSHAEHRALYRTVRSVADELGAPVAVLQDLAGPKMRLGRVAGDAVRLRSGNLVRVVDDGRVGTEELLSVSAPGLVAGLRTGDLIRLADGAIELRVLRRANGGAACRVVHGGTVRSRQGIHVPGARRATTALTAKDRRDLAFGLELGVDAVALSFVTGPRDLRALRAFLRRRGAEPFVIAKIERARALDNLSAILDETDGVMVARGDLGVEIGVERVPLAQQRIIQEARRRQRPVITATQMLESMTERPTPTRAEVSDVAGAVLGGTDGLMLSAETAIGAHAEEAVRTLVRVARTVEREGTLAAAPDLPVDKEEVPLAIARAARMAARAVRADAVVAFTDSGRTARLVASQRPRRLLVGVTHSESTWRRMSFLWGVTPIRIRRARTVDGMIREAETALLRRRLLRRGQQVVVVCGERVQTGATNMIRIRTLGARED
jgi:pyruvate kinase